MKTKHWVSVFQTLRNFQGEIRPFPCGSFQEIAKKHLPLERSLCNFIVALLMPLRFIDNAESRYRLDAVSTVRRTVINGDIIV